MGIHTTHKELTKEDLRLIRDQWNEKTVVEIADIIGCTTATVYRVARVMREMGIELSVKTRKGVLNGLIREVVDEI